MTNDEVSFFLSSFVLRHYPPRVGLRASTHPTDSSRATDESMGEAIRGHTYSRADSRSLRSPSPKHSSECRPKCFGRQRVLFNQCEQRRIANTPPAIILIDRLDRMASMANIGEPDIEQGPFSDWLGKCQAAPKKFFEMAVCSQDIVRKKRKSGNQKMEKRKTRFADFSFPTRFDHARAVIGAPEKDPREAISMAQRKNRPLWLGDSP